MAKIRRGEKTQAVREYLDSHPGAGPTEIVAALAKHGIKMTRAHVSNIKAQITKAGGAKRRARKQEVVENVAPVAVEKPVKPGDVITLEQIKTVARTVRSMGGYVSMVEVLDVIKETGGVKKFKDLAEAIACPEPYAAPDVNVVPF